MSDRFIDPVVAEVHATRAALLAAAGDDIYVLMRQVADRQQRSARRIIRQPMRSGTEQPHALERANEPVSSQESSPHAP
jgi:hypothetical protein